MVQRFRGTDDAKAQRKLIRLPHCWDLRRPGRWGQDDLPAGRVATRRIYTMERTKRSYYVLTVSILGLYDLAVSRGLTLSVRLTPMIDGYAVRIQVGSYNGPCPRFEKHFPAGTPVSEAVDRWRNIRSTFSRWVAVVFRKGSTRVLFSADATNICLFAGWSLWPCKCGPTRDPASIKKAGAPSSTRHASRRRFIDTEEFIDAGRCRGGICKWIYSSTSREALQPTSVISFDLGDTLWAREFVQTFAETPCEGWPNTLSPQLGRLAPKTISMCKASSMWSAVTRSRIVPVDTRSTVQKRSLQCSRFNCTSRTLCDSEGSVS